MIKPIAEQQIELLPGVEEPNSKRAQRNQLKKTKDDIDCKAVNLKAIIRSLETKLQMDPDKISAGSSSFRSSAWRGNTTNSIPRKKESSLGSILVSRRSRDKPTTAPSQPRGVSSARLLSTSQISFEQEESFDNDESSFGSAAADDETLLVTASSTSSQSSRSLKKSVSKRWTAANNRNRSSLTTLPPAFRSSLETMLRPSSAASRRYTTVSLTTDDRHLQKFAVSHRQRSKLYPSKLKRTWPPVHTKAKQRDSFEQERSSSLTDLRLQACVKSRLSSLEALQIPRSSVSLKGLPYFEEDGREVATIPDQVEIIQEDQSERVADEVKDYVGEAAPKDGEYNRLTDDDRWGKASTQINPPKPQERRKASMRIRWGGPEIFFIESRRQRRDDQAYEENDLLNNRFGSSGRTGGSDGPLLPDRFGDRRGDSCPAQPGRPQYNNDWSEDEGEESDTDRESTEISPASPHVWITVCEDVGVENLLWKVKRVWVDPLRDDREEEHIVKDIDLMGIVRKLVGLPETDSATFETPKEGQVVLGYDLSSPNWMVKEVIDIDGEIESSELEASLDDTSMLSKIRDMASLESTTSKFENASIEDSVVVLNGWNVAIERGVNNDEAEDSSSDLLLEPNSELPGSQEKALVQGKGNVFQLEEALCPAVKECSQEKEISNQERPNDMMADTLLMLPLDEAMIHTNSTKLSGSLNWQDREELAKPNAEQKRDVNFEKKKKKKKRQSASLADLLSAPKVTTYLWSET